MSVAVPELPTLFDDSLTDRILDRRETLAATLALMSAANMCPKRWVDRGAHDEYQATVLQPLRDRLGQAAERYSLLAGGPA